MKRMILGILSLATALAVSGQTPELQVGKPDGELRRRKPEFDLTLPDSLRHQRSWINLTPQGVDPVRLEPVVSMSSLMHERQQNLPRSIQVGLDRVTNSLRVGRLSISNGQAWNWGSYPNSYLDARTLSFPMPR